MCCESCLQLLTQLLAVHLVSGRPLPEKPDKEIQSEIQAIMRQVKVNGAGSERFDGCIRWLESLPAVSPFLF
jgi:hypothetical protein